MFSEGPLNVLQVLGLLVAFLLELLFPSSGVVTSITSGTSGAAPNSIAIDWQLIVPNLYIGELAISFRCPAGHPLTIIGGKATARFTASGIYCVRDVAPAEYVSSPIHAVRANGTVIPTFQGGENVPADLIVIASYGEESTIAAPNGPNSTALLFYVGPEDCAKSIIMPDPNSPVPARCHNVDPLTLQAKHSGS
jgi:hypothetical protein